MRWQKLAILYRQLMQYKGQMRARSLLFAAWCDNDDAADVKSISGRCWWKKLQVRGGGGGIVPDIYLIRRLKGGQERSATYSIQLKHIYPSLTQGDAFLRLTDPILANLVRRAAISIFKLKSAPRGWIRQIPRTASLILATPTHQFSK